MAPHFVELEREVEEEAAQQAQIRRDHIVEYREFIGTMPKNLNLEKLRASGGSLRDAVDAALAVRAPEEIPVLSPGAIKKDVGALSAILALLKNDGWITENVASGVPIAGYSKAARKGQRTPRLPLRPSMMEKLFASPLFSGCAGESDIERTRPGTHVCQDELYWSRRDRRAAPRRGRAGQARRHRGAVPEEGPADRRHLCDRHADESIKNDESSRVILVHPHLLELGFLRYVENRRDAGASRLFDLKQSATGKWTKELSRRVNRYVDRTVTDDPRYVFHSLRHEFKDRAEWTISTRVHDRMTGHAPATAGGRYGYGASLDLMAREPEKLDVSFVDWDRLKTAAPRWLIYDGTGIAYRVIIPFTALGLPATGTDD